MLFKKTLGIQINAMTSRAYTRFNQGCGRIRFVKYFKWDSRINAFYSVVLQILIFLIGRNEIY